MTRARLNSDSAVLEAVARPGDHEDLIVRIAGYSARIVHLGGAVQQEMIERFENGV